MLRPTLNEMSFEQLLTEDTELASLRQGYQLASVEKRRMAAEFEYESAMAAEIFNHALLGMHNPAEFPFPSGGDPYRGAVLALAIDPAFAPALLTVGAAEYQLGRTQEAMKLLLRLAETPDEDFVDIIEKAADFLIDEEDYANAKCLYEAAMQRYLTIGVFFNGAAYCFGKLDQPEEAVSYSRKAVELEPNDPRFLNDLGYALMEYGAYKDAEEVLFKAAALSGDGHGIARNNLNDLRRRLQLDNNKQKRAEK
jgi:tetratricopeptide (TPR) repeat protein